MEFFIKPNGNFEVDNAELKWRNFRGIDGEKKFVLVIPNQEIAEELLDLGYNVKIKAPREEGGEPRIELDVFVRYHDKKELEGLNPSVYLITNGKQNLLDDESIGVLDGATLVNVDLEIRPRKWEWNGRSGTKAFLKRMYFTQEYDRLAARYAEEEFPQE